MRPVYESEYEVEDRALEVLRPHGCARATRARHVSANYNVDVIVSANDEDQHHRGCPERRAEPLAAHLKILHAVEAHAANETDDTDDAEAQDDVPGVGRARRHDGDSVQGLARQVQLNYDRNGQQDSV